MRWGGRFRSIVLAAAFALGQVQGALAAFAIFQLGALAQPVVTCSFSTGNCVGVGGATSVITPATCNGVADDAASFTSANSWTRTWLGSHSGLVEWDLSAFSGSTCIIASNTVACGSIVTSPTLSCPFNLPSGSQLLVLGYGVTLQLNSVDKVGGVGIPQGTQFISIRISTANIGDTCLTTNTNADGTTPVQYGKFSVGQPVMVSGFDLQGLWHGSGTGQPPNHMFFERHKITSITTTTPGQICLDAPLAKSYKSTWPLYDSGNSTMGDEGGPATVYALDPSWNSQIEFRGLTFPDRPGSVTIQAEMQKIVFRDVTFSGTFCFAPSQDDEADFINVNEPNCAAVGSGLEIDKLTDNLTYSGGSHWGWQFQSSSGANTFTLSNLTITHCLSGTPYKTVMTNVTFSGTCGNPAYALSIGAQGYGYSKSFFCTNCVIQSSQAAGVFNKGYQDGGVNNTSTTCSTASSCWTMASGVITIPNVANGGPNPIINQERSFAPGANILWSGQYSYEGLCVVSDVTQNVTNTLVTLTGSGGTCAGGFPTTLPLDSGKLYVRVHPMPDFTCSGCTGTAGSIMATWPAHIPYGSYDLVTFTGAQGSTAQFVFGSFGNITSISGNVTAAYTGAGTLSFLVAQNGGTGSGVQVINSSQTVVNYNPTYDVKTTGNRVTLLNGTTTCNGSAGTCSASDSGLAPPDSTYSWIANYTSGAAFSSNADSGGQSHITMTIQTNQGVVVPP